MNTKRVKYEPESECANCGGLHFGSINCPYAVPYDGEDSMGDKRGLQHTAGTMHKMAQGEGGDATGEGK